MYRTVCNPDISLIISYWLLLEFFHVLKIPPTKGCVGFRFYLSFGALQGMTRSGNRLRPVLCDPESEGLLNFAL